jgi:peptidyl-tRNA hydrolase
MEDFIFIKERLNADNEKLKAAIARAIAACIAANEEVDQYDEYGDEAAEAAVQKAEAAVVHLHKLRAEAASKVKNHEQSH